MAADFSWRYGVFCLTFLCVFTFVNGQLHTPPPPGDWPVVVNGIVYNLNWVPEVCKQPRVIGAEEFKFGFVMKNQRKAIMLEHSPYKILGNIEVDPYSCIYIEPGTELQFGPGIGMIINGTLIARVGHLELPMFITQTIRQYFKLVFTTFCRSIRWSLTFRIEYSLIRRQVWNQFTFTG